MSLATLKRKTAAKYNNSSVNSRDGFSINGIHRNQGYVGQSSVGRSLSRAIGKNGVLKGHGSCCGVYKDGPALQSGIVQNECSGERLVKPSVVSTRGMLARRLRWVNRVDNTNGNVWKASSAQNSNTQGDYAEYRKQQALKGCLDANGNEPIVVYPSTCDGITAYTAGQYVGGSQVVSEGKIYQANQLTSQGIETSDWDLVGPCTDILPLSSDEYKACSRKCNEILPEEKIVAISQSEYIMRLKNSCPDLTKEGMHFTHNLGSGLVCGGSSTSV